MDSMFRLTFTLTRSSSLFHSPCSLTLPQSSQNCRRAISQRSISTSHVHLAKKSRRGSEDKPIADVSFNKADLETDCTNALTKFQKEVSDIKQGRQNPAILNNLRIPHHNCNLSAIAAVSQKNAKTFNVLVFDSADVKFVSAAIASSGQNLNPQTVPNNSQQLTISIPKDSASVRSEKLKLLTSKAEQCRIIIRHKRADAMKLVKAINESTDIQKRQEKEISIVVEKVTKQVDSMLETAKADLS